MAPADLTTEQWEVTRLNTDKDLVGKESACYYLLLFKEMIKNPDPRVKWAMQIMDQEGEVCRLVQVFEQ